jgi:hypothetical protein
MESATFLNGVMEYWSDGVLENARGKKFIFAPKDPILQYSSTPAFQLGRGLQDPLQ